MAHIESLSRTRERSPLTVDDLPHVPPDGLAAATFFEAQQERARREQRFAESKRPISLVAELVAVGRRQLCIQTGWVVLDVGSQFLAPLGMNGLVEAIGRADTTHAFLFAAMVIVGPTINTVASTQGFHTGWMQAIKWRGYLSSLLIGKALTIDAGAADLTMGSMTNLLAVDVAWIMALAPVAVWLVVECCKLVLTLLLTVWLLGAASIGGFAVVLVVLPLNVWSINLVKRWQRQLMERKDERMAVVAEALSAIATLKHHVWEGEYERRIRLLRAREVATLRRIKLLEQITGSLVTQTPMLAVIAAFLCRTLLLHEPLSAAQGFTTLALFNLLAGVLGFLPMVVNRYLQAAVAHRRICRFLAAPDVDGRAGAQHLARGSVQIIDGSFTWASPSHATPAPRRRRRRRESSSSLPPTPPLNERLLPTSTTINERLLTRPTTDGHAPAVAQPGAPLVLCAINLQAAPGELVCIYGPCGSGKTSLLSALCGEMRHVAGGRGLVSGLIALSPQVAWVANTTLRNNILYGRAMVPDKYEEVLRACALTADIAQLPAGDETEIGERGVNLSGGQQQRCSLARACYAAAIGAADVCLLDDPLSALDAQVGQHVFHHAICGLLSGVTRLLVSHAVTLTLPRANSVVVLDVDGRMLAQGPPDGSNAHIAHLRKSANLVLPFSSPAPTSPLSQSVSGTATPPSLAPTLGPSAAMTTSSRDGADGGGANGVPLVQREERAQGQAKLRVYLVYLRAFGSVGFLLLWVGVSVVAGALGPGQSLALKMWLDDMSDEAPPAWAGLRHFLCAAAACVSAQLARDAMLPFGSVRASRKLHEAMASSVLRATLAWFQANPLGRILNRFSTDVAAIDSELAGHLSQVLRASIATIAAAAVCMLAPGSLDAMAVVLGAIMLALVLTMIVYLPYSRCAREQKRLESVTKSPFISTFAEACQSAALVRAFGAERRCCLNVVTRCDATNRSVFFLWTTNQWLRVQMSLIGSSVIGAVVFVLLWQSHRISAGDAGFALQFAVQFIGLLQNFFRSKTFLEVLMNDVERVDEYSTKLPVETGNGATPPAEWPAAGAISFTSVSLRYASAGASIFDDLSFDVPARTRVGVVGRTGAGKSSLTVAILRLVELSGGTITIDGLDIRDVALRNLRQRVALVSQDPTLLRGTVRYNLCPIGSEGKGGARIADSVFLLALERAGLRPKIQSLAGGLDAQVAEGGANLSVGERQLLCMARALIRDASVLLMDEATASVDGDADRRIQEMVRSSACFGNATVLTIAHRLHTVAFYDRVLVLDRGAVAEYDAPLTLLQRPEGAFRRLASGTGDLEGLVRIAKG